MILNKIEMFDLITEYVAKFEAKMEPEEISWASRPFEKLCGYSIPGDMEKKPVGLYFPKSLKEIHDASQGRQTPVEITRQDGTKLHAEMILAARASGGVRVYVGIVMEMVRLEAA